MQEVTIPLQEYLELYKKSLALAAVEKEVEKSAEGDLFYVEGCKIREIIETVGVRKNDGG